MNEPKRDKNMEDIAELDVETAEPEESQVGVIDGDEQPDIETDDVESLKAALGKAQAEAVRQQEEVLRIRAEMDNLRKRNARDMDKARKYALERIMGDLLNVGDSLERGLEAAEGEQLTVEHVVEGTSLTLKSLQQVLGKHGLTEINPLGEKFDPELHEALSMVPTNEQKPETVVTVVQKGYLLNDRLLRPARVLVAQKI